MIVLKGALGWANRRTDSQLEAYGPGGRWQRSEFVAPRDPSGDLLGDALARGGAHESAILITVALDRIPGKGGQMIMLGDELLRRITQVVEAFELELRADET